MIFDSRPSNKTIAQKLVDIAEKIQEQKDEKPISPELEAKIKDLKQAEQEKDIAWMCYFSWCTLTPMIKELITKHIKPLFWGGGIYFRYSSFLPFEEEVMSNLDAQIGVVVRREPISGYRFFTITSFLTRHEYNSSQIEIIRSYKMDHNKKLVVGGTAQ